MIAVATLGAKAVMDVGRSLLHAVPRGLDRWRFGRFFGPGAASEDTIIAVVGPYQHPLPQGGNRYVKRFLGRRPDGQLRGENDVLGVNSVRAVAHVSALFATHQQGGRSIPIATDEFVAQRWDATFLSIGGSDSNLKTLDIESLPQQSFYQWGVGADGLPSITAGQRIFSNAGNIEFGLLLRLRNPHSPKHWLFVCAGLGPWGTSGAAWFLAHQWRTLGKRHAAAEFLKVVAVQRGSDESAREEYSVERSGPA
jgi:hypothetical protein